MPLRPERPAANLSGGIAQQFPREVNERRSPIAEQYGTEAQRSDLITGRLQVEFRTRAYRFDESVVAVARPANDLALASGDLGRVASTNFALAFTLLWADRVEEATAEFAAHAGLTSRIGDKVLLMRDLGYRTVALRRLRRVEEVVTIGSAALNLARELGDGYYTGKALANLAWVEWARGNPSEARSLATDAIESWGDADEFMGTEFSWLVVWPLVALDMDEGSVKQARTTLRYLTAPHERRMREPLGAAVSRIVAADQRVDVSTQLAEAVDEARALQLL